MRRITFFITILCIVLAGNINAQTDYGITIAGIEVTSENCDSITGSKISGFVSYNHETKTLTLDNATIKGKIIFSNINDITITLVGENTINGFIGTSTNTKTINGTGSLKVEYIDCYIEKNTIIEDCTIEIATNEDWAMYHHSADEGSKLTIKNANISAEGGAVAIGNFADIELIGCEIVEPANAQILDTEYDGFAGKYICNEDSTIATKVVIKKSTISYGIYVAKVEVTSDNCNNITGDKITGSVSYNPETKTLTLDHANIDDNIYINISKVSDITITLVGENTINGFIETSTNTKTINGSGSLKLIFLASFLEKNTIIEDCTIDIDATTKGYDWAMFGGDESTKLTIKNANLSAKGLSVAMGDFADIELIDCEIVEPVNAQIIDTDFDGEKGKYICNEDGTVANNVVIKKLSGLNEIAQTNSISIYPNPAKDKITIKGKGEVIITNSMGQVVKTYNAHNNYNTYDIEDLPSGVYTIKVNNQTQKLVIE